MTLSAHGIHIELPRGWSGRLFSRGHGVATLHVGNFALALDDGEFGDRSTGAMSDGATRKRVDPDHFFNFPQAIGR